MTKSQVSISGRVRVCLELVKSQDIKGKTVIDVGCSNGWLLTQMEVLHPKKLIGADPSEEAIKKAKNNVKSAKLYIAPANSLPLQSNIADLVTVFDVIEHVPLKGEVEALEEMNRVLKKGGVLLLSTPNDNLVTNLLDPAWYVGHRHYKLGNIKNLLKKAGFKIEKAEVRGGVWFSIYLICLYVSKWIFGKKGFKNKFLESKDDKQFDKPGIHTIFIVAKK